MRAAGVALYLLAERARGQSTAASIPAEGLVLYWFLLLLIRPGSGAKAGPSVSAAAPVPPRVLDIVP